MPRTRHLKGMHKHRLPWWIITHATPLAVASGAVRRAVICLAIAYWAGGCAGLPDDDASVAALAGIHSMTWREQQRAIMSAFRTLQPALDKEFREAEERAAKRRPHAARARSFKRLNANAPRAPALTVPRTEVPTAHVVDVVGNPVTPPIAPSLFRE